MNICALIPVYNEEETIGNIITLLKQINIIDEIIVIDDGSTDQTAEIAKKCGITLIQLKENKGKGAAMQKGIDYILAHYSETAITLMLDGDLIGLTREHINILIDPLRKEEVDMTVGVFNQGRGLTDLAQLVTPNLSGQRAIRVSMLKYICNLENEGYGVEVLINKSVKKHGRLIFVDLPKLTHVMKEEKMGFARGMWARLKMYLEILKSLISRKIKY